MEDNFKINKIVDTDQFPYPSIQSLDFKDISSKKGIKRIKESPWSHAHITAECVTF